MPIFSSVCYINGVKNRNEATKITVFDSFLHKNALLSLKKIHHKLFMHKNKMPMP